jgi:hypothetical protein
MGCRQSVRVPELWELISTSRYCQIDELNCFCYVHEVSEIKKTIHERDN